MLQTVSSSRTNPPPIFLATVATTRGGKAPASRKGRPDPVVRDLVAFKIHLAEKITAEAAMNAARKALEADRAVAPAIYPDSIVHRAVVGQGAFYSETHIKTAIRKRRLALRQEFPVVKNWAKQDSALRLEHQQHLARIRADLKSLPKIKISLLAIFRREERRVKRLHRDARYLQKMQAYSRASNQMWNLYVKMSEAEISSREAALALIELVGVILETRGMYPVEMTDVLTRARLFLSNEGQ